MSLSPSATAPVVLAPGLLCDARLWAPVRARMAAPCRVVELAEADTLDAMADRILNAAEEGAVVAGFSLGGMAALVAAARAPERLGGLVILSTHADADTPGRAAARRAQIARAQAGDFAAQVAELPALYAIDAEGHDGKLVAEMAHAQGAEAFARHVGALLHRPDLCALARAVRTPTLVIAGGDDRLAPPAAARRLAVAIPGAGFTVLPGCGHLTPLESPRVVADLISSLAGAAVQAERRCA